MADDRQQLIHQTLGHLVDDAELLRRACTHASCEDASVGAHANERLEFLGDALLGAAMAECLFRTHPESAEGSLSRTRSRLVSRATLAEAFSETDLAQACRVGPQTPEPWPASIRANLTEAIFAAVYMDGGWPALQTAVDRLLGERARSSSPEEAGDWKNQLQQWCLAEHGELPTYNSERIGGSDHDPVFHATVTIAERQAEAEAGSRRKAETAAAKALMAAIAAGD